MGTNFYFFSDDKSKVQTWFGDEEYKLTDKPRFGYLIHVAKTSCGWLPLFQAHEHIRSVADMKRLYDTGDIEIYDEYEGFYDWDMFEQRVLRFNGGVAGVEPLTPYNQDDLLEWLVDRDMPDHTPVSHFEYAHGRYNDSYFKDPEGYEFDTREFS